MRGSEAARWHARGRGGSSAARQRGRGGVQGGGLRGRDGKGEGEVGWGGESRGGEAMAGDRGMVVVVEGVAWLRGQRVGWRVKERGSGSRRWHVGGGRENDGECGDRGRDVGAGSVGKSRKEWGGEWVVARVQRAVEDSKALGTGSETTAGAESGVATAREHGGKGGRERRKQMVPAGVDSRALEADGKVAGTGSEAVGTGGKTTVGAESGVVAGQRVWGQGWEREEEADGACGGRQWGIGGRWQGSGDRWQGSGDRQRGDCRDREWGGSRAERVGESDGDGAKGEGADGSGGRQRAAGVRGRQ